jgi:hypothetical protein
LLGILALAFILGYSIQEARSSASKIDTNPFSQQIAALEKDLETAESDAERRDIQERLDFVWGMATQIAKDQPLEDTPIEDAVATRQALVAEHQQTSAPELTSIAQHIKRTGIIDDVTEGPVNQSFSMPKGFYLKNDWFMDWGKQQIKVSAGADEDDNEQGAVVVIVYQQGDDVLYGPGKYLTPAKAGPVRIVDYEGYRLKLMADDGTVYYFDALGRVFTKSWDEVVAMITPVPTLTPKPAIDIFPIDSYPNQ